MTAQGAGRVLGGRYRLVREVARGGMAVVWAAHDDVLDRRVAVKVLHAQYADDPEFLERFRREARAAASLSHPNIVPIFDVGEDASTRTPFIVMELIDGGNLKDRIRRAAPLADDEIRGIGSQLADALEYAHRRGLIHRDVKPQNILLGEDGRPRLTDFGIAQALASSGLTRTGAVMGSVHYLAPELVRGRPATPRSDVYSLGAVLFEMATGRVPFGGETDLAVALAHVEETPPVPRALNARLAPDLERTILRALAKSHEQRFSSAAELAAALRKPGGAADGATQRIAIPSAAAASDATRPIATPAHAAPAGRSPRAVPPLVRAEAQTVPVPRRTARPVGRKSSGAGLLGLLLVMAAVLVALGAGFFGLASLSREGVLPPDPTPSPTARTVGTTVPTRPAVVAQVTSTPTANPTAVPTDTPQPSPTAAPPTPTAPPPTQTPTPRPAATPTPRSVAVPQLRGKSLEDARAALQAAGLTTRVVGVNVNVPRDVVNDQAPDAGANVAPGATVEIRVGTGNVSVPDVAGRPRDQALKALQDSGFRVTVRERRDPRVAENAAIATQPAAGAVVPRGSDVELSINPAR